MEILIQDGICGIQLGDRTCVRDKQLALQKIQIFKPILLAGGKK